MSADYSIFFKNSITWMNLLFYFEYSMFTLNPNYYNKDNIKVMLRR
jgi:hypothetical protein